MLLTPLVNFFIYNMESRSIPLISQKSLNIFFRREKYSFMWRRQLTLPGRSPKFVFLEIGNNIFTIFFFLEKQFYGSIQKKLDALSGKKIASDIPDCHCYPICTSMYYDIENTQATWDWRTTYKHNKHSRIDINDKK